MAPRMTLAERLDLTAGRPAGFDYMRLVLALGVVSFHTIDITYGPKLGNQIWANPFYGSIGVWIVPAFFALSGFLVAGSLERCKTIVGFLYLRIIRIFPALVVEIIVSALVLGPLMTTLPLAKYFRDPLVYHYFLNCVGDIHYFLPGLFTRNPLPLVVNRQLWTVPFELQCYAILAALGVLGIAHHRGWFAAVVFAIFGVVAVHWMSHHGLQRVAFSGSALIICFLFGVLAYNFRHIIPYSPILAILAFFGAVWLFLLPKGQILAPLPLSYVVVFLGLTNPRRIAILKTGDYSYGIYLYSIPIQQAVVATRWFPRNGWVDLGISLPLVVLLAVCSWHFFEKRCLEMRRFRPLIDHWFVFSRPGKLLGHIYRLAVPAKI